jgi:hypothetical protein
VTKARIIDDEDLFALAKRTEWIYYELSETSICLFKMSIEITVRMVSDGWNTEQVIELRFSSTDEHHRITSMEELELTMRAGQATEQRLYGRNTV